MNINEVTGQIVNASMKVHSSLGPGLLESAYEACLEYELEKTGLRIQRQVALPVVYEAVTLDIGYRIDLLVEELVIVELKAVHDLTNLHQAQILSYLRLSKLSLGLLINFNVVRLKDGIKRMANSFKE